MTSYESHTIPLLKALTRFHPTYRVKSKFLLLLFTMCLAALPPFAQHPHNPKVFPLSRQVLHAACNCFLSLGCLFPPPSDKLLLGLYHPTSLSPLVNFLCSLKLRKSLPPKTFLPLCSLVTLKLECASASPWGLVRNAHSQDPLQVCGSVGMRCGLRTCIFNECPGDVDAASSGTTFENHPFSVSP